MKCKTFRFKNTIEAFDAEINNFLQSGIEVVSIVGHGTEQHFITIFYREV
jgi:hypothetical protein